MMIPLMPLARASSPAFFQNVADSDSSPSIMVEPCEKKKTGVKWPCRLEDESGMLAVVLSSPHEKN